MTEGFSKRLANLHDRGILPPEQDMHNPRFAGPCPRCGRGVPSDEHRGQYVGALSRLTRDDDTEPIYVCSECGQDEGMFQFLHPGEPLPPINQRVIL